MPMAAIGMAAAAVDAGGRRKRLRVFPAEREEKRRRTEVEEGFGGDPIEVLGDDLMMKVLGMLDERSLARSLLVSRRWFSLASSDSLWSSWNSVDACFRNFQAALVSAGMRLLFKIKGFGSFLHVLPFSVSSYGLVKRIYLVGQKSQDCHIYLVILVRLLTVNVLPQRIGEILIPTGGVQALLCVVTSTAMEAKQLILRTRFGVAMSVHIQLLPVLLAMEGSGQTM